MPIPTSVLTNLYSMIWNIFSFCSFLSKHFRKDKFFYSKDAELQSYNLSRILHNNYFQSFSPFLQSVDFLRGGGSMEGPRNNFFVTCIFIDSSKKNVDPTGRWQHALRKLWVRNPHRSLSNIILSLSPKLPELAVLALLITDHPSCYHHHECVDLKRSFSRFFQ